MCNMHVPFDLSNIKTITYAGAKTINKHNAHMFGLLINQNPLLIIDGSYNMVKNKANFNIYSLTKYKFFEGVIAP